MFVCIENVSWTDDFLRMPWNVCLNCFFPLSFCSIDYHLLEQRSINNSPDLVHKILHNPVKVKLWPRVPRVHVGHLGQGEHSSGDPGDKRWVNRIRGWCWCHTCKSGPELRGPLAWRGICPEPRTWWRQKENVRCSSSLSWDFHSRLGLVLVM